MQDLRDFSDGAAVLDNVKSVVCTAHADFAAQISLGAGLLTAVKTNVGRLDADVHFCRDVAVGVDDRIFTFKNKACDQYCAVAFEDADRSVLGA